MRTSHRLAVASAILMVGILLGAFAGFPAEAFRWERFSDAYEDQVVVTRAEYDSNGGELRVRAESSSATSVLSVYDRGGAPIGVLTRQNATRHDGRFDLASNPQVISVRSSEGGQATVLVSGDDPPTVTPESLPTATPTVAATEPPASATPFENPTPTATAEATEPPPSATPEASPTDGPPLPSPSPTDGPPLPSPSPTDGPPLPSPSPTEPGPPQPRIYLPGLFDRMPLGRG